MSIREGQIVTGPLFGEAMRVETVRPNGPDSSVVGLVGLQTEQFRRVTLTLADRVRSREGVRRSIAWCLARRTGI